MKMILPKLDDLPQNEANCATCTRETNEHCPRRDKKHPNGYIISSFTGEISGMITGCLNYTGIFKR